MGKRNKELWAMVCVSSAEEILNKEEVEQLLAEARSKQALNGLTGIIIFSDGNVLMLVEGEKDVVQAQFTGILRSPKHHSVMKIADMAIPHRYFEDYPLAFKPIHSEQLKSLDDFAEPERKEYLEECLSLNHPIIKLLRDFIKNNT